MLLNRPQIEEILDHVIDMKAKEVFISGEAGGVLLVSLVDEFGEIFYRFDLDQEGNTSYERKL